ncbi:MAG: PRC-barrel domain-containing protein [Xanthomonadaceae bacterium]|nr:PRC-barrel domain-containing protein [Xanthomonadaceae bacterium]
MLIRRIRMQTTLQSDLHEEIKMDINIRKAILAGAIAAVISAPTFAAEGVQYEGSSDASGKTESDMPMRGQSTTGDSLDRQQNMEHKSMGTTAKNQVKDNPIYSRSAESLDGVEIVDVAGEDVGTIESVVLAKDRRSAHAVVSTGGMLGVGAREVLISLDELKTVGDKLQLNITQKQLETRQEYQSEQYVELEGEKPIGGAISEFSAFETEEEASDPSLAPDAPESSQ